MQQYAGIYLLQNYSTSFACPSHPSSGVHKNVTAASGTGHITYLCNNLPPVWPTRPFYRVTIVMFSHTLKNLTPVIVIIRLHAYMSIFIRSNYIQQYAGIYLLQNYSTCFGCPSHPSSWVHKTVTAASGTGHCNSTTTFLQRGLIGHVGGRFLHRYVMWPVPEAAVTVLCTPDNGCDGYPKHTE